MSQNKLQVPLPFASFRSGQNNLALEIRAVLGKALFKQSNDERISQTDNLNA